jgi:hypothetical protein
MSADPLLPVSIYADSGNERRPSGLSANRKLAYTDLSVIRPRGRRMCNKSAAEENTGDLSQSVGILLAVRLASAEILCSLAASLDRDHS